MAGSTLPKKKYGLDRLPPPDPRLRAGPRFGGMLVADHQKRVGGIARQLLLAFRPPRRREGRQSGGAWGGGTGAWLGGVGPPERERKRRHARGLENGRPYRPGGRCLTAIILGHAAREGRPSR